MRLVLSVLAVAVATAHPALAFEPAQGTQTASFNLAPASGLGVVADVRSSTEATGAGRHVNQSSAVGLGWQGGGLKIAATAGLFAYDWSGAKTGQGRVASFAVSHALATTAGGTLSVELRHSRLWEADSSLGITSGRLGWSLKF